MSTRPSSGASNKLAMSLDDMIKGDKGDKGGRRPREREESSSGGAIRKGRGSFSDLSKPYDRPSRGDRGDRGYSRGGDEDSAPPSETSVFVGNLAWSVDWKTLKQHCATAGEVVRADIAQSDEGRSRGFGIVEFANAKAARKAISALHETELAGRTISVRADRGGNVRAGPGGGGGGGGFRGKSSGESSEDPMYSNSGVTGRNGWVRPELTDFVDDGPPPEPKGSMLR